MKICECPKCGSRGLGDRWVPRRMLQQFCHACDWKAEPRIPEKRRITSTKEVVVDDFEGWSYLIYDKYGWMLMDSQTFDTRTSAISSMNETLEQWSKNTDASPLTAVLFNTPSRVKIRGKIFRRIA